MFVGIQGVRAAPAVTAMSSIRHIESGRIVFDENGRASWEWRTADGEVRRETDPARIAALLETHAMEITLSSAEADRTHRTLDDMRALSEEIKQRRSGQGPQEPILLRRAK